VITLLDHTDAVMSIAWSPDELRLGTSSGDRSIRVRPSPSWEGRQRLVGYFPIHLYPSWGSDLAQLGR
jgi:WD40 repeat protein